MNFSDWSVVADIVSALGIILTLVYLAIQIRQNTRQKKLQGLQEATELFLHSYEQVSATVEDAEVFRKGLNDFDSLSTNEKACFHSKIHSLVTGFDSIWNLYMNGLLPENEFVAMRAMFISMLASPGAQRWWSAFKHVPASGLVGI
jgi:hypothetical protein